MISKKAKGELLRTQKTSTYPYLIHIHNDDLGDFYFVNYYKDITYKGQTYTASSFEINPPEKTEKRMGKATFSFSVADGVWIEKIRQTQKRSTIEFIAVIVYEDETLEELENSKFTLTSAVWNESVLTWDMEFDNNLNILVPCDIMNSLTVAGCV